MEAMQQKKTASNIVLILLIFVIFIIASSSGTRVCDDVAAGLKQVDLVLLLGVPEKKVFIEIGPPFQMLSRFDIIPVHERSDGRVVVAELLVSKANLFHLVHGEAVRLSLLVKTSHGKQLSSQLDPEKAVGEEVTDRRAEKLLLSVHDCCDDLLEEEEGEVDVGPLQRDQAHDGHVDGGRGNEGVAREAVLVANLI
jgi:hypothetical protein